MHINSCQVWKGFNLSGDVNWVSLCYNWELIWFLSREWRGNCVFCTVFPGLMLTASLSRLVVNTQLTSKCTYSHINLHTVVTQATFFSLFVVVQGSRFEISAVGSLCLPKLVYYTHSAFHSKHILKHLSDSHRLHMSTREAVSYIQQLENLQGQQGSSYSSLTPPLTPFERPSIFKLLLYSFYYCQSTQLFLIKWNCIFGKSL